VGERRAGHCQVLVRVIENRKARVLEVLRDGSALVLSLSHDRMSASQQRTFIRRFEQTIRREARASRHEDSAVVPAPCANPPSTGHVSGSATMPMVPAFFPSYPSLSLHGIGLKPKPLCYSCR
jgi:predicted component of type VI protein secretion system